MKTNEIRSAFLSYFAEKGHQEIESASLVPHNDPSLLFTNAGMVQFKECFLGREHRDYVRATSSQRCVRAGGKHNDLENVGFTARHHTFFEMLGNFSFGDYFKSEAIAYAWEFLTEVLKLPAEKLWVSVYLDDDESADIWADEIGVPHERISRCGEADNFWSMGDTGPCGPCTEIFYDHGSAITGGPPGSEDQDGDRFIEIWNLVFMQYERTADGQLNPLPKPSVDTGMGLERLAAILQGVHNNYEIDLFVALLEAVQAICAPTELSEVAQKVIADHIRSTAFLMMDDVMPSNEGRGYVLRRIMRRAIRFAYHAGVREPFFHKLVAPLVEQMGEAYPDLKIKQEEIVQRILKEEKQFAKTLEQGLALLEAKISTLAGQDLIPGDLAFQLYDTYGFPLDLTLDVALERGLTVDQNGFKAALEKQRLQSKAHQHFGYDMQTHLPDLDPTEFVGFDQREARAKVLAVVLQDASEMLVLDQTPFYPEGGGQVGDTGTIVNTDGGVFQVEQTFKQGDAILHQGKTLSGAFQEGGQVVASVDAARQDIMANHTATHLLHAALRAVLGEHVEQKGSLVEAERLRFDFSNPDGLSPEQIHDVERLVNAKIRENLAVSPELVSKDVAKSRGAMALFGEKYGDTVRMLTIGDFSLELCGGTHVAHTGQIALFKIISQAGIASGIRRVEAVTGYFALSWVDQQLDCLAAASSVLKTKPEQLQSKLEGLIAEHKSLSKQHAKAGAGAVSQLGEKLASSAELFGAIHVVIKKIELDSPKELRNLVDDLKSRFEKVIVVLAQEGGGKLGLIAGINAPALEAVSFNSSDLLKQLTAHVGGRGGGRPDLAQGGGENPAALEKGLSSVHQWVSAQLNEQSE